MLFTTERLDIRKLQSTDIDSFYDMQRNPKVMQYIKRHMNRLESEKELARFISYDKDEAKFFNIWAVTRKDDHEFIGICGVYKNDKSEFEIAYRLRELYWKKGYGREIATSLIRYCFDELKLNELTAYVHKENKGSVRILEKEMQFIEEFYDDKTHFYERVYKLKRKND